MRLERLGSEEHQRQLQVTEAEGQLRTEQERLSALQGFLERLDKELENWATVDQ